MSVQVKHSRTIHQGRIFQVVQEEVVLPNQTSATFDMIRHPGASAMIPVFENGDIVLLRQYRHAVNDYVWEFPAGTLNTSEEYLACAQRELVEEIGYRAKEWHRLTCVSPVPAYSNERVEIFLACGLEKAEQKLDGDEVLEVHRMPLSQAFEMFRQGRICDSKTIVGLFLTQEWMKENMPGM